MRLTPDLLLTSNIFVNCLKDRELDLRGNKIPQIENLGVIGDQVDTINFADNDIRCLENFPLFRRLKTLILDNNQISSFASGLTSSISNLRALSLWNNQIGKLSDVDVLRDFKYLETLNLIDNPVCRRDHYRLYIIHRLPQLKVLDFNKIKRKEREEAAVLFGDHIEVAATTTQRSRPVLTAAQRDRIKKAIITAKTTEQMEKLDKILAAGIVPDDEVLAALGVSETGGSKEEKQGESGKLSETKTTSDTSAPLVSKPSVPNTRTTPSADVKQSAVKDSGKETKGNADSTSESSKTKAGNSEPSEANTSISEPSEEKSGTRAKRSPSKSSPSPRRTPSKRARVQSVDKLSEESSNDAIAGVDQMKVAELKSALQERGITPKGRKADLAKQLKEEILKEQK